MTGVVDVRVRGAIGVVQLAEGTDVYTLRPRFVEQGVWIRPFKDIVYLMPPLVIGDDELDILTWAVRTVLLLGPDISHRRHLTPHRGWALCHRSVSLWWK